MQKPIRILIVEDEPDDIDLAKDEIYKLIKECVFEVSATRESFLEALNTFQPDVILSDYTLPQFDGMQALKLTLQHTPLTPFIIWTGSISEDVAVDCVKAGANNYIFKDNLKRLVPAILRALDEKELRLTRQQAEEDAKERQRQLGILLSNLPGPVYRCRNDADYTIEFVSDGITELSGYPAEEFRKNRRHFGEMIHPDDRERVWAEVQASLQNGLPFELSYRILTATGAEKWVWEKGQGISDENGQLRALEGFITDITVRKQAEEKYQSIFENAMEGIFQSSPQGRYLNLNPAMARLYGYDSPKEMIESIKNIATQIYVDPEKRSEFIGVLNSRNSIENFETRNYRKDGSIIWTATSARAVRDQNGNVLYYEGFIQDVTYRKKAEEALQNNEKRFRALIENGLDDISLLAVDGTLLWESPSTVRNLGYTPNEFVGRNIFEIMHPEDQAWTQKIFAKLSKRPGDRQRGTFRLRRADGAWRWVEAIATNLLSEPSVKAIVINYRDVTEQKQAEIELQQKNADLALVNALNEVINRGESVDVVVNLMAKEIKRNFSADGATVYLLNQDGHSLTMRQYFLSSKLTQKIEKLIGRSIPPIEIPIREGGHFHRVLQSGDGVITNDQQEIQQWMEEFVETAFLPPASQGVIRRLIPQIYKLLNINSTILIPLISDGKAIGLLDISSPQFFTEADLRRLEAIGMQLSIAIRRKQVDEALRESQARYQNLVETSHDLIWSVDAQSRFTFVNRASREIYGYEPEELIGRSFFEVLDKEHYQATLQQYQKAVANADEFREVEMHVRHRDGKQIILSANSIVLRDEYGAVTGVVGSSHDITMRKRVEDVLQEERNLLRTLINNIPDRIYAMDTQGRKTLSNTADWKASGGNTMEDVIGKTDFDMYPPLLAEGFWKLDKAVLDSGQSVINHEEPGLDANGNLVSILTTKIPLRDEEGRVIGLVGIGRDITERKQTEEKLRYSENRYRLITQATNDIIWEWNLTTHQLFWSENAQHIFGYSAEEIGPDEAWWDSHIHPDDHERVITKLARLMEGTETIWKEEYRFLLKNGSYAYVSDRAYIERDATGIPLRMIGAMADITLRKEAEAERQALLEIMQGLANTKDLHELLSLVHHSIGKVIYAENFFVVLHQEGTGLFEEIYSVDQYDPPAPPSKLENSITSYVFRSGKPLLLTQASFEELAAQGEVRLVGTDSASWLGVPLKTSGKTIGVMVVQDYENDNRYAEREKEFLSSIATQVALVIERKRADEALRESEEHYRTIFEGVQDAIFVESPDGKILMVNERACEMFGYSQAEFLTKTVYDLVPPGHPVLMADGTEAVLSAEPRETLNQRASGEVFPIEISGRVQVIGGQKVLLVVVRDMTERKRSETAEREQRVLAEALRDTAETLSKTLDYGEVLDHILAAVGRVVPHDAASILLIEGECAQVVRSHGYDKHNYDPEILGIKLPLAETINLHQILETRQPVVVYDTFSYAGWHRLPETDWLRSNVGAPISIYGEIIGFICLDSQTPEYFTPVHAERLEAFANQAAIAMHNARLLQQAQDELAERKRSEELLRESEKKFSGAFEYASIGMALVAPNGFYLRVNWAMCSLLGYSEAEMLQKTFQDLTHPDDLENSLNCIHQLLHGEIDSFQLEKRYFHKQGRIVWGLLNASLVKDSQGKPQYFIAQIQDITERKKVETALIESNKQFRTLFEASPDAIVLIDPIGDWPIIDCNTAACQMNGYTREEMIGQTIDLLNAVPSEIERRAEYLESIRQAGVLHFETLHKRKDGTIFTVDISTSIIRVGNRDIVLGIDRDVTERKRAENQLRFEKERFDSIAAAVPGIICSFRMRSDGSICVPFASPVIHDVYGLYPEEVQYDATPLFAGIHQDDLPQVIAAVMKSARTLSLWHTEFRYQHPVKGEVWTEGQAMPLQEADGSTIWHGFIYDITERKRAEEEIRRAARETSALLETSLALTNLDLEATLQTIGNSASSLFAADGCRVFLTERDGETLRCVLALQENTVAFSDLRIKVGEGVTGAVAASGQAEIVNEMHKDPRAVQVVGTDEEEEAIMFAPLKERDLTIGIINIRRLGSGRPFYPADLELLEAFASMAASAVSKARLFEETQRRLAELRASEERFRQLADNIQEAFWITDAENSREIYMSPAIETIWGRSIQSLMYEPNAYLNSVFSEDRPILLDAIEKEKRGEKMQLEYRIVRPDGSLRWIWDRAFPILDESGSVKRIAGISADITERKQREQELRKLSRAVEQSGSTIVITDTSGMIEYVNPKFTRTTGYSYEEVIGQSTRILKSGFTSEEDYKDLWQTILRGQEWHGELLNKKKDGELFWESVTISPILNDRKEITHFVGVKEDITERKQNELEIRRHVAELEAVYENGLSVGRLLEPTEIGNRVIETFARYLPWHHVTIRLHKEGSDELELVSFNLPHLKENGRIHAEQHFVSRISKVGQGLSGWVIQTGMPLRTGNVHAHPQYIDGHMGIQSGLYMPLKIGERVIGVITVESEAPDAFTEQDERLLATLANQTAIAFENARLYEAMQKELAGRKRVEDALRISETHYRALADSITDILFELDQNLHYTHWNKASETLLGIPAQDAIGKSMEEMLGVNEEQTRIKMIYEEVLRNHQPKTFETTFVINGERRFFEVNAYPSMRGVSVVAKDVTDRKRTETIMQKRFELMEYSAKHSLSELMLRTVDEVSELTDSKIGFFHFMKEDQIHLGMQTWSTNALQLFHVSPETGGHQSLDQAGVWAEAVRQRRPLIQNDYESLARRKGTPEGHVPIVREMIIPIIRNERVMAVMGIGNKSQDYTTHDLELAARLADYAWDITERKQMELALELERNQLVQRVEERTADLSRANSNLARALRVKDEFLANMSHELRTPLNAILGLSESLGEQIAGPLNEKQQKYISTISESGHHLLSLINDILDLAKIDAGQITLDINKVDIHSICQMSLRMVKQLAQKKNQEISLQIDHGLGLMWADERRLKQMIVNLLGNAVKFTPENGKLGLEVHGDEEANQISITVWDNGIGIKQEDLARLFQPFVQLDSGLAREATGTGLGLALVAQMARLHGGSVSAVSDPDKGSRFTIVLPWEPALAVDTASRMKITGKFRAIQFDEKNKPTILLVEDTKEVVMMLKDYLELAGYKVITAQDGVDGLVQARHAKPDLILMDVQMPRMDGFETTRKLRSDPNFRYTPIIALTALAMPHDRERCLEAGMDEYISKPVNLKALIKIIQNCLFEQETRAQ